MIRWCAVLVSFSLLSAVAAENPVDTVGVKGGLVVCIGPTYEQLAELGARDGFLVQGLETDADKVKRLRESLSAKGLWGRVTVREFDGRNLPYVDNLVSVVVSGVGCRVSREELLRVLAPGGQAVSLDPQPTAPVTLSKPVPKDTDEWTHYLYGPDNNAVSRDRVVASPRSMQWITGPTYARHHNHLASLSAMVSTAGRLFSIEDLGPPLSVRLPADWRLIARDAFNGVTLWERPIDKWQPSITGFRSGPVQLSRRLVAIGNRVYVALNYGGPLLCLDAASGETLRTFEGTDGVEEILYQGGTLHLVVAGDGAKGRRRIVALEAESGKELWTYRGEQAEGGIAGATLTVGDKRLYFHDGSGVVAIERSDGSAAWRRPLPSVSKRPSWLSPTVVYHDGVVLCADRAVEYPEQWKQNKKLVSGMLSHGGPALLTALSADDGKELWHADASECFHGAPDVFVIDGLVWASQGPARYFFEVLRPILTELVGPDFYIETVTGRDLRTGKVSRTVDAAAAFTLAHHHRCFRNRATERFIIMGRTGIELISMDGGRSLRHNWTRGMCQYGVMPANGLLYVPPHACACYNAGKLNGFFVYSARKEAAWEERGESRLSKGPAYDRRGTDRPGTAGSSLVGSGERAGQWSRRSSAVDDWPAYRHDNARTGCSASSVADRLQLAWECKLGGKLSAPTSAGGKVFVCSVDRHAVCALDAGTGERVWSYVAEGRVDSPPTYRQGRVYFGAADGSIRCLSASDGALVWRYDAAPGRRSIVVRNQLESPWPVPGSVLVRDGCVYAFAGRSSFIDGGVYLLRLNARTGELQQRRQIYTRNAETGRQTVDDVDSLHLAGLLYDIPSSSGDALFVREAHLSLDGEMVKEQLSHLYSPGGFLDDAWWHRYSLVYGKRFKNGPGGNAPGRTGGAPQGRVVVYDDRHVYGYSELRGGRYRLACTPKVARGGPKQQSPTVWSNVKCPVKVEAMALARAAGAQQGVAKRLVVAGPPARALTDIGVLRGGEGGLLAVVDAGSGEIVSQCSVESTPVFDGMGVSRGQVILSLSSGSVVAFK